MEVVVSGVGERDHGHVVDLRRAECTRRVILAFAWIVLWARSAGRAIGNQPKKGQGKGRRVTASKPHRTAVDLLHGIRFLVLVILVLSVVSVVLTLIQLGEIL